MRRLTVFVSTAACVSALLAGCAASSKTAAKDVSITACKAGPTGGHPTARGTIRNRSSKDSVYTVHVKFKDSSGNGVGDGFAAVAKVDAGATAKWSATGTLNAKGPVKCEVSNVTRNAAP